MKKQVKYEKNMKHFFFGCYATKGWCYKYRHRNFNVYPNNLFLGKQLSF